MKKLIVLFLVATVLSCSSNEDQNQNETSLAVTSGSVLDGKVLSFKNEESFVKEYSELSTLNNDELQKWISSKKVVSLLNSSDDSAGMEEDVIADSRLIYSDALKSILNSESKMKISGKVLWLNERNFYLLSNNEINKSSKELLDIKDNLEIYGQLLSVSGSAKSLTSRVVIPNENKTKTFITDEGAFNIPGSRIRHVLDLFNETILFNNDVQSSKMYLRSTLQYRSCSTLGGCKWKTDTTNLKYFNASYITITSYMGIWTGSLFNDMQATSGKTYLLATWKAVTPLSIAAQGENFNVSGPVKFYTGDSWHEVLLSWY